LHVGLNVLLCVSLQRCSKVQEACALSVLHGDLWVTTTIDNTDSIPVGLRIVRYETFEVWLLHAVLSHDFVEFYPHNTLQFVSSNCMS
jgi:hypothetical protein